MKPHDFFCNPLLSFCAQILHHFKGSKSVVGMQVDFPGRNESVSCLSCLPELVKSKRNQISVFFFNGIDSILLLLSFQIYFELFANFFRVEHYKEYTWSLLMLCTMFGYTRELISLASACSENILFSTCYILFAKFQMNLCVFAFQRISVLD